MKKTQWLSDFFSLCSSVCIIVCLSLLFIDQIGIQNKDGYPLTSWTAYVAWAIGVIGFFCLAIFFEEIEPRE